MNLEQFFSVNNSVALAFSGGVDSSYLLHAALRYGAQVHAYFLKSAFQPQFELEDARWLATELHAPLTVLDCAILDAPSVAENTPLRCYHCKSAIFGMLRKKVQEDGYTVLIDGTNASDDADSRPGMQALTELSVLSPLRLCGITKEEIRTLSRRAGLFTWDKPAYACLATRIPTGTPITASALEKIERGENLLFSMGFSNFRLRVIQEGAKIQLPGEQMIRVLENRKAILERLSADFADIYLDLVSR